MSPEDETKIEESFGKSWAGLLHVSPSQLSRFYKKVWNEAIDAVRDKSKVNLKTDLGLEENVLSIDEESLKKLKK